MPSLRLLLITTFGLGHMRPASGTWGSMPTVVLAAALMFAGAGPAASPVLYHAVLIAWMLIFCIACLVGGREAEAAFGKKDPGQAVADETAGQAIPLLFLPAVATSTTNHTLLTLALAFVAFRVFDIIKLPPARQLQRLKGGIGILIDDLIAGVHALIVVQIVTRLMM
jgi:phosphatidylglycerophosphatase A